MENLDKEHDHDGCCDAGCKDYLLDYPLSLRRCVAALEHLDSKKLLVDAEFRKEVQELERKYLSKYGPIYEDRCALVTGGRNPTPEEYAGIPEDRVQELDHKGQPIVSQPDFKGIPKFWLTAMLNHPALADIIHKSDHIALEKLVDIKIGALPNSPGFRLDFVFGENPFFTNTVLSKEYHLAAPTSSSEQDFIYDHAVGTEINWKEGKNLCFKTVTKTQKQKNGKGSRVVKREEPQDSFFHFFDPPTLPDEEESEEEEDFEELEQELEQDYEIGDIIKSDIVPHAVHWFTGKALEDYYEGEGDNDGDYDDEEYDEEDDDDSGEDDSDTEPTPKAKLTAEQQQQCKQQ